jgi:hypothetical protein
MGSPGAIDPGGISDFQREAGRHLTQGTDPIIGSYR